MDIFIHQLTKDECKLKIMVKNRNEDFFLKNNIFGSLNPGKVNHFKKLWRSGQLDDDDKNVVWDWIDSFVIISERYTASINKNLVVQ